MNEQAAVEQTVDAAAVWTVETWLQLAEIFTACLAPIASALIAVLVVWLAFRYDWKKERQKLLLQRELDEIYQLRTAAGRATEVLCGQGLRGESKQSTRDALRVINDKRAFFRSDKTLLQLLRDFDNRANIMIEDQGVYDTIEQAHAARDEVQEIFENICRECDRVLQRDP